MALVVASRLLKQERAVMNSSDAAQNAAIAVFDSHVDAQEAIESLCQSGFDTSRLSVVGREYHSPGRVFGCYGAGGHALHWGHSSAFWTGLWARLSGWAFLAIPKSEVILIAGPLAGSVVAALDNGPIFGNLSAFGAGLYSLGVPKDAVSAYEEAVRTGKFLVIAHGAASELAGVRITLHRLNQLSENGRRTG